MKNRNFIISVAVAAVLVGLHAQTAIAEESNRIRIDVLEPPLRKTMIHDYPVSVGLVFPKGELTSLPGGIITAMIPKSAAYFQIRLFVQEYSGTVWFDDFTATQEETIMTSPGKQ